MCGSSTPASAMWPAVDLQLAQRVVEVEPPGVHHRIPQGLHGNMVVGSSFAALEEIAEWVARRGS